MSLIAFNKHPGKKAFHCANSESDQIKLDPVKEEFSRELPKKSSTDSFLWMGLP